MLIEIRPEDQADMTALSKLYITSRTRKLVPLSDIATFTRGVGPQSIAHSGQLASVTISFNLPPNGEQTRRGLPQGILPPSYQKTNPAGAPILTLALTSDQVPLSRLDEYAQTTIAQRLSTVNGVAQVLVYGAQKYAVRVQLDPSQLATRNLALEDIATAISSQNVNLPTGVLQGPRMALTVQASGQLQSAEEFRDLVVAYHNGAQST